jgi:hypothetical protein
MPNIFDPLDYLNVARSVVSALLVQPAGQLPPPNAFSGGGVYAIYYSGAFPAYAPISDRDIPIYVGKAVPAGGRLGGAPMLNDDADAVDLIEPNPGNSLFARLRQHAASVDAARNLERADFSCRYLTVVPVWIVFAERILISRFRPIWNVWVNGFGNHHVGTTRYGQARTEWDTIHPGRQWAEHCQPCSRTEEEIFARISANVH